MVGRGREVVPGPMGEGLGKEEGAAGAAPREGSRRDEIGLRRFALPRCTRVRSRDGGRCAFPLEGGGVCGSTYQPEIDLIVGVALGGK